MRFVIVTGMSGAGKSTAMKMMEDMGFFCIDNLPIPLLDKLVDFATNFDTQMKNVAIGIDARSGENLDKVQDMLEILKSKDVQYEVLFLDAEDAVLVKRYKETRRSHPLAQGERVDKGIMRERQKMEFLKKEADYIIDTSRLLTRELKTELDRMKNLTACMLRSFLLDSSMEFRQILISSWMCGFCQIRIMWKNFVQRQEMMWKSSSMS